MKYHFNYIIIPCDFMSFDICPTCAIEGKVSEVEYLQHEDRALVLCPDEDCSYNYERHYISREYGDAPVSGWLLEAMSLPMNLSNTPRMKNRHTDTITWLYSIREVVYLWFSEEVLSMAYAVLPRLNSGSYYYRMTPSAKRLMELSDEEVYLGKQIIPDLVRIIITLKYYYSKFRFSILAD